MKSLLLCLSLLSVTAAFAYQEFGVCNYGKQTLDTVVCYGPTVMKSTTVTGDIKVTGSLQASDVNAINLLIQGATDLKNSIVRGSSVITGSFHADHVEFKRGISVTGNDLVLSSTKVNGMVTVTSPDKSPYVQVQCGSTITGSILFDGKAGTVQITGDSLVQGKVLNGALEFVKRDCSNS